MLIQYFAEGECLQLPTNMKRKAAEGGTEGLQRSKELHCAHAEGN